MVCIRIGTHIVSMLLGKAITSDVLLVISNLVGSYSCKNQIQINILTHLDGITGDILDLDLDLDLLNQPPSIEQKVVPNYVKKEISMQTIIIEVF